MKTVILPILISALLLGSSLNAGTSSIDQQASPSKPQSRQLSLGERIAYQYAIEEVYWRHRIWPKENPGPKPPLDEVMSAAQIGKKVEDYLHDSQLLEEKQQRPITPEQLQAEMDHMAERSRQPEVLRELFAALGDDPAIIAECLAKPVLTMRNGAFGPSETGPIVQSQAPDATPTWAFTTSKSGAVYVLPEITGSACPNDTWNVPAFLPSPRGLHTAVWTGSEMIVWGGGVFGGRNTGGRYNPSTDSWTPTTTSGAPSGRTRHTAIWTGKEMIVWGGIDINSTRTNTGGRYDPSSDSWAATSLANAPTGRQSHTAVWTGNEMIVWAGFGSGGFVNTGGRYEPITDSWAATTTVNAPSARQAPTAVWTGSEMIVWGGSGLDNVITNTGGRYNPATNNWTITSITNVPTARSGHGAVWTGSKMIVWGGYDGTSTLNTGGQYDPSGDSWVATSLANVPSARYDPTAVWTGNEMIVWGGYLTGTGGRYNPLTNVWTPTNNVSAPDARYFHTAVWTGSEMIVWGGYDGDTELNSGGRYNPTTDSWISSNNPPHARQAHTAVWTGSEMIVWGGQDRDGGIGLSSGGIYSPSTDSWSATSFTNAPAPRYAHTAVWTGSEMVVWGGYDINAFNSGGRYSPAADSWTPTTTINAPAAREFHTAVWTGNEMVVWGGDMRTSGTYLNTGGRYNPVSDSWIPTNIANAPTARSSHTAIWTGTEMVIWGGLGTTSFNTGGRYNPNVDDWTATTTTNAPAGRRLHTAVWTGFQMIVWGGYNSGGQVNTGGRYNPSTNTWTTTSAINAPSGRYQHTAVWTGSEMIIWAGKGLTLLNTGGRYNPVTDGWTTTSVINAPAARSLHTSVWIGTKMIVWGGYAGGGSSFDTGGRYCALAPPAVQSAVSRKAHALSGIFNVDLPLTGTPGLECRAGGATDDYTIVATFGSGITVNGSPQAEVISGIATVGTGGVSNGGMVTISGNIVTVPLTNVANAQTINVRLNDVSSGFSSDNITIPMSILVGDTNANGAVNSGDVAQTKARLGQTLDATNFRSDVNANGVINSADISQIKSLLGTGLP